MLESRAATRPMSAHRRSTRVAQNTAERFLDKSERRIIVHCQKLLHDPNVPIEDQRRLERLLSQAEARLQEIASTQN